MIMRDTRTPSYNNIIVIQLGIIMFVLCMHGIDVFYVLNYFFVAECDVTVYVESSATFCHYY